MGPIRTSVFALVTILLLSVSLDSRAAYIYTYTGVDFTSVDNNVPSVVYTTSMAVTVTMELSSALGDNFDNFPTKKGPSTSLSPIHFSMFDGINTITDTSPGVSAIFYFKTDSAGDITNWEVEGDVFNTVGSTSVENDIFTSSRPCKACNSASYDVVPFPAQKGTTGESSSAANDLMGQWSGPTAVSVPEPGAMALLGIGLAGLGFSRRKH